MISSLSSWVTTHSQAGKVWAPSLRWEVLRQVLGFRAAEAVVDTASAGVGKCSGQDQMTLLHLHLGVDVDVVVPSFWQVLVAVVAVVHLLHTIQMLRFTT